MDNSNIINLEEELRQAMLHSDVSKLDKLIADSLTFIAPSGAVINKQDDLDSHRSGIMKFSRIEPSEQHIQDHDTFFVVTVKMQIEGTYNKEPVNGTFRYLRIWAKSQDLWQVIAGSCQPCQ